MFKVFLSSLVIFILDLTRKGYIQAHPNLAAIAIIFTILTKKYLKRLTRLYKDLCFNCSFNYYLHIKVRAPDRDI